MLWILVDVRVSISFETLHMSCLYSTAHAYTFVVTPVRLLVNSMCATHKQILLIIGSRFNVECATDLRSLNSLTPEGCNVLTSHRQSTVYSVGLCG